MRTTLKSARSLPASTSRPHYPSRNKDGTLQTYQVLQTKITSLAKVTRKSIDVEYLTNGIPFLYDFQLGTFPLSEFLVSRTMSGNALRRLTMMGMVGSFAA